MKALLNLIICCFAITGTYAQSSVFDIARSGSLKDIEEAFKNHPDTINSINDAGYSSLILSTYSGNINVDYFLTQHCDNINYVSSQGTALMAAAVKGDHFMTKVLLEHNADPNLRDTKDTTALHYAVIFGHVEVASLLLNANANPNLKDATGATALDHANRMQNEAILKLFNHTKS